MKIFIYGCGCGSTPTHIRRVNAYAIEHDLDLDLVNSKYQEEAQPEHQEWLRKIGARADAYEPIIVTDDKAELLKLWQPS